MDINIDIGGDQLSITGTVDYLVIADLKTNDNELIQLKKKIRIQKQIIKTVRLHFSQQFGPQILDAF